MTSGKVIPRCHFTKIAPASIGRLSKPFCLVVAMELREMPANEVVLRSGGLLSMAVV